RPRLSSIDVDIFAYSFPSGFIVIFTALLGYVAFLLLKNKSKLKKIVIISAWLCLIIVVSASRIRAAISYPSDVLAGFLLGGLWLAVCIVGTKALEYYGIDS
ncbi:MAG: phosphatase PAP2 family protein, partial [Tepidanaerobacteraceae bacterium]